MPTNPNKLSQFWQELKARNVFRVTTLYAAVAFGLLEVIDIVSGPLHLPAWAWTAVIFLSALGVPVAATLSWVLCYTGRDDEILAIPWFHTHHLSGLTGERK